MHFQIANTGPLTETSLTFCWAGRIREEPKEMHCPSGFLASRYPQQHPAKAWLLHWEHTACHPGEAVTLWWLLTREETTELLTVYLNHEICPLQGLLVPHCRGSLGLNRTNKKVKRKWGCFEHFTQVSVILFIILMVPTLTSFSVSSRMLIGSSLPISINLHTYFYTKWNSAEWLKTIGLCK